MIPATLCALVAIGLAFRVPQSAGNFIDGVLIVVMGQAAIIYVFWFAENWRASKEELK